MKLAALVENSWILGPKTYSKALFQRPGFWADNAPSQYKNYKLTDPRIPKNIIIKVAKKHPNGLQGWRSAIQSLINMGSAKGASMRRLRQIGKWVSDEIRKTHGQVI